MRYVSEQFKEKQDQIIRPPLKLHFEINTSVQDPLSIAAEYLDDFRDFDYTVAPVIDPPASTNEYYYAVVGDGKGIDDPNRICAAVINGGTFPTPTHLVPTGVTIVANANQEVLIGSTSDDYANYLAGNAPISVSFKGGLIPERIRIERKGLSYGSTWQAYKTVDNTDMKEEFVIPEDSYGTMYRYRFYLLNTTQGGRYQLNWIRSNPSLHPLINIPPIAFENDYISSVSISEATDITSQSLPSYDMTIECLDSNGQYSPETSYWNTTRYNFAEGTYCYLKAGYEADGITEYIPLIFGKLASKPTYEHGKITFKVSVPISKYGYMPNANFEVDSKPNNSLATGSEVDSYRFTDISNFQYLFDTVDIFHDSTDENNSVSNNYAVLTRSEIMQLIANALGGYITAGFNTVDLRNTNDIQYKDIDAYLPRYDQVKNTLECQSKVGSIDIVRNTNTLSAGYEDIEAGARYPVSSSYVDTLYILPSWSYGKYTITDYQAADTTATFDNYVSEETLLSNGNIRITIKVRVTNNKTTSIKPIVRFFRVDNIQNHETETINSNSSEIYTNDNDFVTNTYTADKVKRVARLINDMNCQYEVDVVQNIRYELGDVIRLETEKGVYKTCVITALQFKLPGSNGHVTCRKIFSLMDSAYAVPDPQGSLYVNFPTGGYYYVGKNDGMAIFGTFTYSNRCFFYGLGFSTFTKTPYGAELSINKKLVDLNGHEWGIFFYNVDNSYTTNNPCVIELPDYDPSSGANANSWGAIELIKALYNEQKMTPPVDYTCTLVNP